MLIQKRKQRELIYRDQGDKNGVLNLTAAMGHNTE
jgi:hypothetical protein